MTLSKTFHFNEYTSNDIVSLAVSTPLEGDINRSLVAGWSSWHLMTDVAAAVCLFTASMSLNLADDKCHYAGRHEHDNGRHRCRYHNWWTRVTSALSTFLNLLLLFVGLGARHCTQNRNQLQLGLMPCTSNATSYRYPTHNMLANCAACEITWAYSRINVHGMHVTLAHELSDFSMIWSIPPTWRRSV